MKYALVVIMLLVSGIADAAELLTFKDGSTMVFQDRYAKGSEVCTHKALGEFCVEKKDIARISKTDQDSEYEASAASVDSNLVGQRQKENSYTRKSQEMQERKEAHVRADKDSQERQDRLFEKKSTW